MRVAIVSNAQMGPLNFSSTLWEQIRSADCIIAADGAADRLIEASILPHYVVGDFDSAKVSESELNAKGVQTFRHPPEKDDTDFSLCLDKAVSMSPKSIEVFFSSDERFDYSLDAFLSATKVEQPVTFEAETWRAKILGPFQSRLELKALPQGQKLSVMPLVGGVTLKTSGLRWELDWKNEALPTRSQSNYALKSEVFIELSSGIALLVLEKSAAFSAA